MLLLFFFPRRDVFPQGLPDEYAFVTTFKFRKTSRREDWYLWQVFDKYGIPQVGRPPANSDQFDFVCVGVAGYRVNQTMVELNDF